MPLKLSREEVEALVEHAAEMHWSYDGDYWFLSNNCAVETLKLLRSGTDHPALRDLDSIMPNGLLKLLEGRGVADPTPLEDPRKPCAWAIASTPSATVTRPCSRSSASA